MRTQRLVSKLGLAVIAASIAGAVLWIEHGHRIDIATPTGAAFAAPVGTACPDNENRPPSVDCIVFMQGAVASDVRSRVNAATSVPAAPADAPGSAEPPGPACPAHNENVPYSANCLRFLSGWFWRADVLETAVEAPVAAPK
jgi:hypothetical protein